MASPDPPDAKASRRANAENPGSRERLDPRDCRGISVLRLASTGFQDHREMMVYRVCRGGPGPRERLGPKGHSAPTGFQAYRACWECQAGPAGRAPWGRPAVRARRASAVRRAQPGSWETRVPWAHLGSREHLALTGGPGQPAQ